MWPFLGHTLFPPPTQAWLQRASSDPGAQGWGAWSRAEEPPPEPGDGAGKEEAPAEDDPEDAGLPLPPLEGEDLAEYPEPDQELEAIKLRLWAMERAQGPEPPGARALAGHQEGAGAALASQPLSPEAGCTCPGLPVEKVESDHRSVYVGNVDYGGTAEELEAYFNPCGEVHRVTILCDKLSGHPKGYAYVEFAAEGAAQAAVELDESIFRGRVIKVLPKRTNLPGISSTNRGGFRGQPGARGPFPHSSLQGGARFRPRGRNRGRGRFSPWCSPY
ncbi:embryonic polyadenylate-binding protein 2 [Hyaena hyaena]|uniref:embryonic polyadenylate-binding protein 2 n=1 Tax=Hyaena hyaena TaxID=95912 RepID=UPI001922F7A5|nr:embryonic polyadenylate-binding protein 2 [Hyaena hyaena]